MNLTLAQIMSLVTTQVAGRTDYSLSELSLYANIALDELCARVEMASLQSTVVRSTESGTSSVTIPDNCHYVTALSNLSLATPESGRTLTPSNYAEIDSQTTGTGVPKLWATYRDQVLLWPSADSAYSMQIRFQEKVPTMVASSATPGIDPKYHMAVAYRAAAITAQMREDLENEAICQARYLSFVGSVPSDRAMQQQQAPFSFSMPKWRRH